MVPGWRIRQLLFASVKPISTFLAVDRGEGVQQIIDVEADLELVALEIDFDLVLGFFLLRVVSLQGQHSGLQHQANTAVFLVRENGGSLHALHAVHPGPLPPSCWDLQDHAPIFGETAVNELRSEANVANLGTHVVRADRQLEISLRTQNALQLQHALARNDDLLRRLRSRLQLGLAECEAVAIGRDRAQRLALGLEQHDR